MTKFWRSLVLAILASILATACTSNGGNDTSPSTTTTAEAKPQLREDRCAPLDALNVTSILGGGEIKQTPCEVTTDIARSANANGLLVQMVWVRTSDGVRLTVDVFNNFAHRRRNNGLVPLEEAVWPEAEWGTIQALGLSRKCADDTAHRGSFYLDMGETYLRVWMSTESGKFQEGMPLDRGSSTKLISFAQQTVVPALYQK